MRPLPSEDFRFVGRILLSRQNDLFSRDRKSTRLNSSHSQISYAVFCLKKQIARLALDLTAARKPPQPGLEVVHPAPDIPHVRPALGRLRSLSPPIPVRPL